MMKYAAVIGAVLMVGLFLGGCAATKECAAKLSNVQMEKYLSDQQVKELQDREAIEAARIRDLKEANDRLSAQLAEEVGKGQVTIGQTAGGLKVSVVQELLFGSGSAELGNVGKAVIEKVAGALKGIDDRLIMIEGHTDNVPIGPRIASKFPTNWELSAARATAVARYLQDEGVNPSHLGASGFAEYRPVAPNTTEQNRQKNRRIDIVLAPTACEAEAPVSLNR